MRIVSLLPSATEIVFALGLGDELVGVTHECDFPPEVAGDPQVTRSTNDLAGRSSREIDRLVGDAVHGGSSLYALDEDALAAADPDLILTQELCAVCAVSYREVNDVARAIDADITVVSLEPTSVEGVLNSISTVGAMTDAEDAAVDVVGEPARTAAQARDAPRQPPRARPAAGPGGRPRMARPALRARSLGPRAGPPGRWLGPPRAGGRGIGPDDLGRGPRGRSRDARPDALRLPPRRDRDRVGADAATDRLGELEAVRRGQVFAVDGSAYFSRPGPRVIDGIGLLAEIFDPDGFVETSPLGSWTPLL